MESQLLRFITAGSVDDGKSTLIGRLLHDSKSVFEDQLNAISRTSARRGQQAVDLSLLTDGLQAEREQGITIDVAYRYFSTPKRRFIIGDTPGHEQYTRNMVTAASTANLAIILVDARKGMLNQTRRHSFLAKQLGIPHIVLAVNKMDMVDYQQARFDEICQQYRRFANAIGLNDIHCVPMSALNGDMLVERGNNLDWYQGPALLELLETIEIENDLNQQDFRFPVQWVCRPQTAEHPDFRGFTGRIESGEIQVGGEIMVLPSGRRSQVKQILLGDAELQHAQAPQSITLLLADEIDISRGDMLVKPEQAPPESRQFEAMVCWFAESPLDRNRKYLIKHTSKTVKGLVGELLYRVDINTLERQVSDQLHMNDIACIRFKVQQPLSLDLYQHNRATGSFIVIDEFNNHTVAAGMVLKTSQY